MTKEKHKKFKCVTEQVSQVSAVNQAKNIYKQIQTRSDTFITKKEKEKKQAEKRINLKI